MTATEIAPGGWTQPRAFSPSLEAPLGAWRRAGPAMWIFHGGAWLLGPPGSRSGGSALCIKYVQCSGLARGVLFSPLWSCFNLPLASVLSVHSSCLPKTQDTSVWCQLPHFPVALGGLLALLCLRFPICRVGMILAPPSWAVESVNEWVHVICLGQHLAQSNPR